MKRWQDRGEVLDSDEEDLCADTESQGKEIPRKRTKVHHEGSEPLDKPLSSEKGFLRTARSEEEDDAGHASATVQSGANASETEVTEGNAGPTLSGSMTTLSAAAIYNEPAWTTQRPTTIYSRRGKLPRYGLSRPRELVPVVSQLERESVRFEELSTFIAPSSSAVPSEEVLSSHGDIQKSQEPGEPSLTPPTSEQQPVTDFPSRASSPLSELSDPPDSPPPFLDVFRSTQSLLVPSATESLARSQNDNNGHSLDGLGSMRLHKELLDAFSTQGPVRRSLRARQEKQLHPYMYDKALYQRQCRERGMKPITLAEQRANETQEQSHSQDETQQNSGMQPASSTIVSSSPFESTSCTTRAVDPVGVPGNNAQSQQSSDDELPDFHTLISCKATKRGHDRKRRKVDHPNFRAETASADGLDARDDGFDIPPSPPYSAKDRGTAESFRPPTAVFRLPRGLSPKGLPTPEISSEARPPHRFEVPISSAESSPPRTLRRTPISRHRETVTSDDSSNDSEPASSEVDDRRLLKERRRIRGVLPASWLKIDLKAQKRQVAPASYESNGGSPPPATAPAKGVARRLLSRGPASSSRFVLEIPDDDQSDRSTQSKTSIPEQHALETSRLRGVTFTGGPIDADDMEVDWIDPMLAGSRYENNQSGSRHNPRPRAANSSLQHRVTGQDMSEERNGLRGMHGRETKKRKPAARRKGQLQKHHNKPLELSILDATASPARSTGKLPQFVRLAARQARQAADGGRHSPSRKFIRLATRADTEEANSTLSNWRRGTLKKRYRPTADVVPQPLLAKQAGSSTVDEQRELLLETSSGQTQARLSGSAPRAMSRHIPTSRHLRLPQQPKQTQFKPRTPRAAHGTNQRSDESSVATPDHKPRPSKRAVLRVVRYRGAQLESLEDPHDEHNRALAFERRIQCLTESVARRGATPVDGSLPLTRFLQNDTRSTGDGIAYTQTNSPAPATQQSTYATEARPAPLTHRSRKRQARRLETDTRDYRQPSEPLPDADVPPDEPAVEILANARTVLQGLGPVGTRYPVDFDIRPLPQGTYFHESTFIGSGDFSASLAFGKRDLDAGYGTLTIHINGTAHSWSAWTEEVSSAFAEIPPATTAVLQTLVGLDNEALAIHRAAVTANVDHMLRSVVRYISTCLHFYDPVDRSSFIQKLIQIAQDMAEVANDLPALTGVSDHLRQRILQYSLVFTQQARVISSSSFVSADLRTQSEAAFMSSVSRLASCLVPTKLATLRDAYESCRVSTCRESGIRDDDSIAGIVILYHSSRATSGLQSPFWKSVSMCLDQNLADFTKVSDIDILWYAIYSLLPALDFDASGMISTHGDREIPEVDFTLPKQLVESTLALYGASSAVRGSNINEYVRVTVRRCHHLVTKWRWWRCESILGPIYDLFAHRGLGLLHKEEGKGSPDFLTHLSSGGDLDLRPQSNDCSFHIFLKLLASTLRGLGLHGICTDKKIGGIVWRFIPNHARMYRKDDEVKQTDLDALRNHCDLLSVLYFASPPSSRPGITLLQDLVDHSSSHREACRISVKAWANLASFQASTSEPTEVLNPFAQWYRDMVQITVNQYRLARTEAEQQYAEAKAQGIFDTTDDVLERTIASNQRQIAATLVDLLAAIKRAVVSSSSMDIAVTLVESCEPWKVFDSFNPGERRLLSVFREALSLIKALLDVQQKYKSRRESQPHSEDSQDYGDISMFQDLEAMDEEAVPNTGAADVVELMAEPLNHLMSNAFGAELSPDDAFLTQLVDIWVQLSVHLVSKGLRTWHNFVDDYSPGAWFSLRDTDQHSKFTPYLLARIVESDPNSAMRLRPIALLAWLKSMAERDAKLRYQHLLTTALLNSNDDEPLLENPPLIRSSSNGKYHVSLAEFRQRRVAILSSVLSNMQEAYSNSVYGGAQALAESRRQYSEMLRQLMQAMKTNYQDLQIQDSSAAAGIDVQGSYVDFIQQVVSCLQQYTTDICPIDRFFTDSLAFPLPATDPTYVVGRLKSYVPKLYEAKTRKQLAVFVHTVAERAVVDGQQTYLVEQFFAAMVGTPETGSATAPTLRYVMLTAVLPTYIEHALTTACSWILALPILEACARTVARLIYDTDLDSDDGVSAVLDQVGVVLSSSQRVVAYALEHPGQLALPHAQRTLSDIFGLSRSATTVTSFLKRTTDKAANVVSRMRTLLAQAKCIAAYLAAPGDFYDLDVPYGTLDAGSDNWPDTRTFSAKQFQDAMTQDWSTTDGRYFVRRGNTFKEAVVDRDNDRAKEDLLRTIGDFVRCWDRCESRAAGQVGRGGDGWGLGSLVV